MKNQYTPSRTEQKAQEDRRRVKAFKSACEKQQRDMDAYDAKPQQN